jgi:ankyrin repeat protein
VVRGGRHKGREGWSATTAEVASGRVCMAEDEAKVVDEKVMEQRVGSADMSVHHLASFGNADRLKQIYAAPGAPDVDVLDGWSCSPFTWACRNGHDACARFLMEKGADVEQVSYGGMRPLHHASHGAHEAVLKTLLSAKADVRVGDASGATAMHYLAAKGVLALVNMALEAGADPNQANQSGVTPLHRACQQGHASVINRLAAVGANVNAAVRGPY